jgi:hypothetical protein
MNITIETSTVKEKAPEDRQALIEIIKTAHQGVEAAARQALQQAFTAGAALLKLKQQVNHGEWGNYLDRHCGLNTRTADVYMQLAKHRSVIEANSQHAANLSLRGALNMTDNNTDELAALKARVAELERAAKPPPSPDPRNFPRYDPTEGMTMPASALREMVNCVPDSFVRDIAQRDARAPTGPSAQGAIPSSQPLSNIRTGGGGTGWAREIPLGPQPGINHIDRLLDHADAQDRHERMVQEAQRQAMLKAASKP